MMARLPLRFLRVALALTLTAPAAGVAAEFVEFYKLGLAAAESREWATAIEMMEKAIAAQPSAKVRVTKSFFFRRYLPHFHLGQARFESGDCRGALAAWDESESQEVVTRFPEYQSLQQGRTACRQISSLQEALDDALRVLDRAEAAAAESRRRLSGLAAGDADARVLLEHQTETELTLDRARRQIGSADVALQEVEQVAALANQAAEEFRAIRRRAEGLLSAHLEQRQAEAAGEIASLESSARRELAASEYLRPYPAAVSRRRRELAAAVQRAESAASGDLSMGELEALRADLTRAIRNLQRAAEPPPAALTTAVRAYFARDYEGVLTDLEDRAFESARARSHSHLLQAAALFALYRASGGADSGLLERAGEQVRACHAADPSRLPPPAVFPPTFVAFFDRQLAEANSKEEAVAGTGP